MGRFGKCLGICVLAAGMLAGCTGAKPPEVTAPATVTGARAYRPGSTASASLLADIWAQYGEEERFAVFGGLMEHPVENAPGDLDMEQKDLWLERFSIPVTHGQEISSGAAMSHLMNGNLWTVVALRLNSEENIAPMAQAWHQALQNRYWVAGRPARLMFARAGEHLVMAYGSREQMKTLKEKLPAAVPGIRILFDESITV